MSDFMIVNYFTCFISQEIKVIIHGKQVGLWSTKIYTFLLKLSAVISSSRGHYGPFTKMKMSWIVKTRLVGTFRVVFRCQKFSVYRIQFLNRFL